MRKGEACGGGLVRVGEGHAAVPREGPYAFLQPLAPSQTGQGVLLHDIGVLGAWKACLQLRQQSGRPCLPFAAALSPHENAMTHMSDEAQRAYNDHLTMTLGFRCGCAGLVESTAVTVAWTPGRLGKPQPAGPPPRLSNG